MSNMLEQAIVDAKALREAAVKSAEAAIVEKYNDEVKDAVSKLLEQDDEMDLGMDGARSRSRSRQHCYGASTNGSSF